MYLSRAAAVFAEILTLVSVTALVGTRPCFADTIHEMEPNNAFEQANLLVGYNDLVARGTSTVEGEIRETDYDFFRFQVTIPGTVRFTATQLGPVIGAQDLYFFLYDSGGASVGGFPTLTSDSQVLTLGSGVYSAQMFRHTRFQIPTDYRLEVQGLTGIVTGIVPEPGTLALLLAGTLVTGAGVLHRGACAPRRRKRTGAA